MFGVKTAALAAKAAVTLAGLLGLTAMALPAAAQGSAAPGGAAAGAAPRLTLTTVVEKLDHPWDLAFTPDGAMLFTEKCRGLSVRLPDGTVRRLLGNTGDFATRADDLFCQGQSGVHGVTVDPDWAQGRRFAYVFSASSLTTNPRSNRVIRVVVDAGYTRASDRMDIVPDIAFKEAARLGGPGNHSGGRLRFGPDGFLWITTGDNHESRVPQSPTLLGGKVLRVDRDGKAAPGNSAPTGFDPRIYSYGHRNPQGITFRPEGGPDAGHAFIAEHGPNHSDEVQRLVPGGNAGWDPQNRPNLRCDDGYCGYSGDVRTMPMTDTQRFPNAMPPAWTNYGRSEGAGPAEFLSGTAWGAWQGRLAVAYMRAQRLDVYTLDATGKVTEAVRADIPSTRLRSLIVGPDSALWAATDDGRVVRIGAEAVR